jgi:hypothetical protein
MSTPLFTLHRGYIPHVQITYIDLTIRPFSHRSHHRLFVLPSEVYIFDRVYNTNIPTTGICFLTTNRNVSRSTWWLQTSNQITLLSVISKPGQPPPPRQRHTSTFLVTKSKLPCMSTSVTPSRQSHRSSIPYPWSRVYWGAFGLPQQGRLPVTV